MTFEEWWFRDDQNDWTEIATAIAHDAWDAATKQERERCAVKCDEIEDKWRAEAEKHDISIDHGRRDGAMWCAVAIREATE